MTEETTGHIFDPRTHRGTRRPLSQAETLPAASYTDDAWYRREVETIFRRDWLLAGRKEQFPDPGDYVFVDVCGMPVVVVRGEEGVLRAFVAVCRHRGTLLVNADGHCKSFVCPYHGWTYDLDGRLRAARTMEHVEGFDRADFGLDPVRVETWHGFVFINLDLGATALTDQLAGATDVIEAYKPDELVVTRTRSYEVACNWKSYYENAHEPYHVPPVHGRSIQGFAPLETWLFDESDGNYGLLYGLFPGSLALLPGEVSPFPPIPGRGGTGALRHDVVALYPNASMVCSTEAVWTLVVWPRGPGRLRVTYSLLFPCSTTERDDFAGEVERYYTRLDIVNQEDNDITERQYIGLAAGIHRGGRFSPYEHVVHAFNNYVLDRVVGRG